MGSAHKIEDYEEFEDDSGHLQSGESLLQGQFTIESFLNSGGFGITYTARDSLDRKVVIKECFPSSFCHRSNSSVRARSREHHADFRSIVKLFVQEAKSLSKLRHPNIVGVHQVFEDNQTAYMALDFIDGRDLHDTLSDKNHGLKPSEVKAMLVQLLEAIDFMHGKKILHRDISPDNILIDGDNKPILIDFGAARQELQQSDRAQSAFRVVKDGYSPQEFYLAGSPQYPSSDLYALAATFYHLIAGEAPPNSQSRLAAIAGNDPDPCVPLSEKAVGYDKPFLDAIDMALRVLPRDRIQSAADWLALIKDTASEVTAPAISAPKPVQIGADPVEDTIVKLVNSFQHEDLTTEEEPADIVTPEAEAVSKKPNPYEALAAKFNEIDDDEVTSDTPEMLLDPDAIAEEDAGDDVEAEAVLMPDPAPEEPVETSPVANNIPETQENVVAIVTMPARKRLLLASVAAMALIGVAVLTQTIGQQPSDTQSGPVTHESASSGGPGMLTVPAEEIQTAGIAIGPNSEVSVPLTYDMVATPVPLQAAEQAMPFVQEALAAAPEVEARSNVVLQTIASTTGKNAELILPADRPLNPTQGLSFLKPDLVVPAAMLEVHFDGDTPAILPAKLVVAEPVTAAEPAPAASGTAFVNSDDTVLDAASIMAGWSVALPFDHSPAAPNTIDTINGQAASWMQKGVQITSVNGQPISSIDEIGSVLQKTVQPGAASEILVTFGLKNPVDGSASEQTAALPVVQEFVFLNGSRFESRFVNGKWQTVAVHIPEQVNSDLQTGDILQAYVGTGEEISGPDTFVDILEQNTSANEVVLNFTVLRDGGIWLATYAYKGAAI